MEKEVEYCRSLRSGRTAGKLGLLLNRAVVRVISQQQQGLAQNLQQNKPANNSAWMGRDLWGLTLSWGAIPRKAAGVRKSVVSREVAPCRLPLLPWMAQHLCTHRQCWRESLTYEKQTWSREPPLQWWGPRKECGVDMIKIQYVCLCNSPRINVKKMLSYWFLS